VSHAALSSAATNSLRSANERAGEFGFEAAALRFATAASIAAASIMPLAKTRAASST